MRLFFDDFSRWVDDFSKTKSDMEKIKKTSGIKLGFALKETGPLCLLRFTQEGALYAARILVAREVSARSVL